MVLTTTCSDSLLDGGQVVQADLDVNGLLQAVQSAPIPFDSVVIELRRVSDSSLAVQVSIDADSLNVAPDGTVAVDVTVTLLTDPEDFHLYVAVFGGGRVWFEIIDQITISSGDITTAEVPSPVYVGPGADGTDLAVSPEDTVITGGDSVLVTGTVYEGQTAVVGAPVWFESSDSSLVPAPRQVGLNQAWVIVPIDLDGAVTITAHAFTRTGTLSGLSDIAFFPRPDRLEMVSGNNQNLNPGEQAPEPLVVRVVDAAGAPFDLGYQVVFTVVAGPSGTTVQPETTLTDALGLAQTTLTAGNVAGTIQIDAVAQGLAGSPVSFAASVADVTGPANIAISAGDAQTSTVGLAVPVRPSVLVTDVVGSPVPDVTVTFAVESGGGTVAGATQTTDSSGVATVGDWTLGTLAGPNTLSAAVTGLSPVTFTALGVPDAPDTLTIVSGNDQSADAGTTLPQPLVVEVQDRYGNTIPSVTVDWLALDGSVTPTTTQTDTAGQAQTTWTLGTNSQSQTVTATVQNLQPAIFSATAIFQTPSILLDLVGADRIPVRGSADLAITLTSPAGVGGVTVSVTSDNPAIVAVQSPGTVSIAEGQTTGQITLDGVNAGTTTIRGMASGYNDGTLAVQASALVLSLPSTLNVPFGGTASIPVQISTPAPAGGEVVTLISSDPAVVGVVTSTVTIPEGLQTANGSVSGVFPGTATVTGTSATYGTAQSTVSTTANLNIVQTSATINASFGTDIQIRLQSGGSPIAAPAGGITVDLTPGDPACVSATSPVTIPAGLVDVTATVTYGGSATLRCVTTLAASAPDITPDSITVTVNPAPGITLGRVTVGSGLQRSWSGSLGASNHGGVTVTVASSNAAVAVVAPDANTPGTASVDIPVPDGNTGFTFYVQGVEGQVDSVTVTATANGFTDGVTTAIVIQPGLDVSGLNTSATTLSPDDAFTVRVGLPYADSSDIYELQAIRAGGTPVTATVVSDTPSVARLVTTADTAGTVIVTIGVGQSRSASSVANGGVALDPLTAGTTQVSASIAGFVATTGSAGAARTVTVSAPNINLNAVTVGSGLQRSLTGTLGASNHGGVTVTVTSSNPAVAVVAPDANTPGADSVMIPVADGSTGFSFYVQGLEGQADTISMTATAAGFNPRTSAINVIQPGLDLSGINASTTTLSPDDAFSVRIGLPYADSSDIYELQAIRAGGTPVTATVVSDTPSVARLVTTADTAGTVIVTIGVGQSRSPSSVATGGVALDPLAPGATLASASIPGFIATTGSAGASRVVTVSAPTISLGAVTVGSGLQRSRSGTLGASNHGGVTVTVTSSNPAVAVVAPDANTPGADSVMIPVADGSTGFSFYVQGLEGQADTVTLSATATGFVDGTTTATVVQPGLDLSGLNTTTTTLSPNDAFTVRIGLPYADSTDIYELQAIRPGGTPVTATVTSSQPGVGQLEVAAFTAGTVTITIGVGQSRSASSVATGGVAFVPLTAGTTDVSASIPGFISTTGVNGGSRTIAVSAPGISLSSTTVGAGLQTAWTGTLGAPDHGGVTVTLTSSNPAVAVVAPDANTPGADSASVAVADGNTGFTFYVQGIEGQTGTVTITARASGFTDGTSTAQVIQPGLDLSSISTSYSASANDDPFTVRIGLPYPDGSDIYQLQAIRAGGTAVTATVTSSNAGVGRLVTTADTAATVTVTIDIGQSSSGSSVAMGGVAFDPLAPGTTDVAAAIPGFVATTGSAGASRTVTVNP